MVNISIKMYFRSAVVHLRTLNFCASRYVFYEKIKARHKKPAQNSHLRGLIIVFIIIMDIGKLLIIIIKELLKQYGTYVTWKTAYYFNFYKTI